MTKEEISKIKEHIELHARRERGAIKITALLWKAVAELESIPDLKEQISDLGKYQSDECSIAYMLGAESKAEHLSKLEKEIAELKDDNKVMADNYSKMEQKFYSNLTKAKEIILKLYNAGRDVLMCRAEEKAYDNLDEAISDKSIEQFLNEVEKMTDEEKQKCLDCANCDIDGSCIAKQEAPFGSFVCEHNEQFEPLDTGEVEKCDKETESLL